MNPKIIKLLFDCHTFDKERQGTSTFLAGLINALPEVMLNEFRGYALEVYCAANSATSISKYIDTPFYYIKIPKNFISRNLFFLPVLSFRIKSDFVVSQYVRPIYCNKYSVSVIHDLLFLDFPNYFSFHYSFFRKIFFGLSAKFSSNIFTISNYSKDRISSTYGVLRSKIGILTCAPQIHSAHPNIAKTTNRISFLYVSRLEPRKRHEWCVSVFEELIKDGFDVELVIVGAGSDGYATALKQDFKECARRYSDRFHHYEGISPEKLAELYCDADIFLCPTIGEGFGIPVIEAAAYGKPCVVADSTALSELKGVCVGEFFAKNNYSAFVTSTLKVLLNLPEYANRSAAKSSEITEIFNWKNAARTFISEIIKTYDGHVDNNENLKF